MTIAQIVNNIENRVKREILHMPVIYGLAKQSYNQKKAEYKSQLPTLSSQEQTIVNALRQEGVFITTLNQFSIPETTEAINVAHQILLDSPEFYGDSNSQGIPGNTLVNYPAILRLGLDKSLLNIAENYIGLPIFYIGAEVKREFPNGEYAGARKWHLDTEDYSMVKIIVYLNDVDENSGPFEYISRNKSEIVVNKLRYKCGLIADKLLENYVPYQNWISCLGKQGTVTVADTCQVFHRAKPAINRERLSITFHYTSQYPIHLRSKNLIISTSVDHICQNLSERQLKCFFSRSQPYLVRRKFLR